MDGAVEGDAEDGATGGGETRGETKARLIHKIREIRTRTRANKGIYTTILKLRYIYQEVNKGRTRPKTRDLITRH